MGIVLIGEDGPVRQRYSAAFQAKVMRALFRQRLAMVRFRMRPKRDPAPAGRRNPNRYRSHRVRDW